MDKYINATQYEITLQAVLSDPGQAAAAPGITKALRLLKEAKPLIHCKDCKYSSKSSGKWVCIKIPAHVIQIHPGHFCQDGKPKTKGG